MLCWSPPGGGLTWHGKFPSLTSLELWGSSATDEAVASLGQLPALETLILEGSALTPMGAEALARLKRLRGLSLGPAATEQTIKGGALLLALVTLPRLEALRLGDDQAWGKGCAGLSNGFLEGLAALTGLTKLDLLG